MPDASNIPLQQHLTEHLSFAQPSICLARSKTTNASPIIGWGNLHASASGRVFPNGGDLESRDRARALSNATSPSQPFYYAVPVHVHGLSPHSTALEYCARIGGDRVREEGTTNVGEDDYLTGAELNPYEVRTCRHRTSQDARSVPKKNDLSTSDAPTHGRSRCRRNNATSLYDPSHFSRSSYELDLGLDTKISRSSVSVPLKLQHCAFAVLRLTSRVTLNDVVHPGLQHQSGGLQVKTFNMVKVDFDF
ncbi:hypothetical protein FRC04_005596 [Tulasnella sp. 424]|nr:hypothetical protein FRC04_005596 [Tulasnella sp. 424]KAG8962723.1 hypothetical protein FRC05_005141 [Tulasnella sp. 425]